MNLFKKVKKGFTLVELVVVIAVIGVLAGVGVAVYSGITKNAKESADDQIIAQLNTQLKAKGALEHNATAYDAYLDAVEIGFDLKKMTPRAGDFYVWDEEHDLFGVGKGNGSSIEITAKDSSVDFTNKDAKQWLFTKELGAYEKYSWLALGDKYEGDLTVKAGFDAGDAIITGLIKYDGSDAGQEVVIRTNGGNLTLNAPNDEIKHFGSANIINADDVKVGTFLEMGKSSTLNIKKGKVAFDKDGCTSMIVVKASAAEIQAGAVVVVDTTKSPSSIVVVDADTKAAMDASSDCSIVAYPSQIAVPTNDTVAFVGNTSYTNLKDAFDAANDNEIISLYKDVAYACASKSISITKKITLNMGEKKIDVSGATTAQANRLFNVWGQLTINGGEIINESTASGAAVIVVLTNGSLVCNNLKMSNPENKELIYTNGNQTGISIELNNCNFEGRCYFPAQGGYSINGGTYAGKCGAFYIKSGTTKIVSGTFSSVGTDGDWIHQSSGAAWIGCAVIIEGCEYGGHGTPVAFITGGTFIPGANGTNYNNYGILVISWRKTTSDAYCKPIMAGTTVVYRAGEVTGCTSTKPPYYHFTDSNTTLVNP